MATCSTDLTSHLEELDVPGLAAAIVKNGRVVCTAVAGLADIEKNQPVTPDTLFLIASVSKTITATAIMQLFEQERFRLSDNVNRHLPYAIRVPAAPNAPITFRQVLTHTSSIADNPAYINCPESCPYGSSPIPFVTRGADSPISLAEFTKGYFTPGGPYYDAEKNFESAPPGTLVSYSNMGVTLMGYLVELISGKPFDQYTRDHIFEPLGMTKTSWRLAGIDRSLLAMPYDKSAAGFVPFGQFGEVDYPDGMVRSSVTELARFLLAYIEGGEFGGQRILRARTVDDMLKSHTSRTQGFVWLRRTIGGRITWGHDGADHGAGAEMWFDPARKTGVILMTNGIWEDNTALLENLFREADRY